MIVKPDWLPAFVQSRVAEEAARNEGAARGIAQAQGMTLFGTIGYSSYLRPDGSVWICDDEDRAAATPTWQWWQAAPREALGAIKVAAERRASRRVACSRWSAGLMLVVAAMLSACSRSPNEPELTARVAAVVARYDSAWNRRDTTIVGEFLAPEYQYFTSQGAVSSRAATMAFLADPEYLLDRAERTELAVSLRGPVAVVSSRWRGQGSYRGEAFTDDQRCGQIWLREGPSWQMLSEHCVQIGPAANAGAARELPAIALRRGIIHLDEKDG